jgi:hypothetical protein
LYYAEGDVIIMPGWTVQYPYVTGEVDESRGKVPSDAVEGSAALRRFNLDEATQIQTYEFSPLKLGGTIGAGVLGVMAVIGILLAATSCPTVSIVERDRHVVVGEAYPGAIFRSLQRDDLLPLPPLSSGKLTLRVSNDNPEIQYTDFASLLVVAHSAKQRALATHDGRAILVGETTAPQHATDLNGEDVTRAVRANDREVWQSSLERGSAAERRDLREGLILTFPQSPRGAAALELTAETTLWMSAVFQRCFAMTGSSFGPLMNAANKSSRVANDEWRDREGVDLRVEVWRDGAWVRAATVQTPGVSALRSMAVPLGDSDGGELRVRLTSGFGFWRVGSVALAPLLDERPQTITIKPRSAAGALLDSTDALYHVLAKPGEAIDLTFDVPAGERATQTIFFASSGYYNPLPPPKRVPQLRALNRIRATSGGLAAFGLELYAANRAHLNEESR